MGEEEDEDEDDAAAADDDMALSSKPREELHPWRLGCLDFLGDREVDQFEGELS